MNWREEAAEKLRRYRAMRAATENIPAELDRLRLESQAIRSANPDRAPVRGGMDREDRLIENLMRREELKRSQRSAKLWLGMTDRALEALDPEEKLILTGLYIQPAKGNVDRLCQQLELEKSSIYRRRDKALLRFTLALYGELES